MVGYCPPMLGAGTCVTYGPASGTTATITPQWDYVITITTTSDYDYWRDKEEEEKVKAQLKAKQVEKMRSFWKGDTKRHEFRQPKWSHNKPMGRQR